MIDAGAILIAKTTTSEDCMWIESSNPVNGITGNPFDTRLFGFLRFNNL